MAPKSATIVVHPEFAEALTVPRLGPVQGACKGFPPLHVLWPKALRELMSGKMPDCKRAHQARRCCNWFRSLAPEAQLECLIHHGVYVARMTHVADEEPDVDSDSGTGSEEESVVDWGSAVEEESEHEPQTAEPWPAGKRRRLCKGGFPHLCDATVRHCVIPTLAGNSRLSRELGETVYSVDWGATKPKPEVLHLFGESHRPGLPPLLRALFGRECGVTYYATVDLIKSASAKWVLANVEHLGDAYCRLQLLTTPTASQGAIDDSVRVELVEVRQNRRRVDAQDGHSEVSFLLARKWAFVSAAEVLRVEDVGDVTFAPRQFRGQVPVNESTLTLAKGSLILNPELPGCTLALHRSCCKVWGPRSWKIPEAVEFSKTTAEGWEAPRVNAQLVVALQQRIACVQEGALRKRLFTGLAKWLNSMQKQELQHLVKESFGLGAEIDQSIQRVPCHEISIEMAGPQFEETPLDTLLEVHQEQQPHSLIHGTKEALTQGLNRFSMEYRSQRRKPTLTLEGLGATLYAISDPSGSLADKTCVINVKGEPVLGRIVVWRCPTQLPWDLELWEAVEKPRGQPSYLNCIVVSRKGRALSYMAGGDFDGDLCCISTNKTLLGIVSETAAAVEKVDVKKLEKVIEGKLKKDKEAFEEDRERGEQLRTYALEKASTCNLRGQLCAWAERMQYLALASPADPALRRLAFLWGICSHRAMDVPKHYAASDVLELCYKMIAESGLEIRGKRSTKHIQDKMRLEINFDYRQPDRRCAELLGPHLEDLVLGRVMCLPRVHLGYEAGVAVRRIWLTRCTDKAWERNGDRTMLEEIAGWLLHRSRQMGSAAVITRSGDAARWLQVVLKSRGSPLTSITWLLQTPLR